MLIPRSYIVTQYGGRVITLLHTPVTLISEGFPAIISSLVLPETCSHDAYGMSEKHKALKISL